VAGYVCNVEPDTKFIAFKDTTHSIDDERRSRPHPSKKMGTSACGNKAIAFASKAVSCNNALEDTHKLLIKIIDL
jgi:hypothetical protein